MRTELRRSDEHHEIARAATAWRDGGAIDEATRTAILERFPDDRRRARPAFRILFFLLTVAGGLGFWGFAAAVLSVPLSGSPGELAHAVLLALLAAAAAAGAEVAIRALRLWRFGVEEGLAALALGFGVGALAFFLDAASALHETVPGILGVALAAGATLVAVRWGMPLSGLVAAAGALFAARELPAARLGWTLAALALVAFAHRVSRPDAAAPAHRARAEEARAAGLVALYVGVHPSIGATDLFDSAPLADVALSLSWFAIIALPLAIVAFGFARRRRIDLALGALLALATDASVVDALDLGPAWALLLIAAALLGALAFAVRAALGAAPGRTRAGFTDRELLAASESTSWLELGATLAALAPAPRSPEPEPAMQGGGGEFGGAGARAKF